MIYKRFITCLAMTALLCLPVYGADDIGDWLVPKGLAYTDEADDKAAPPDQAEPSAKAPGKAESKETKEPKAQKAERADKADKADKKEQPQRWKAASDSEIAKRLDGLDTLTITPVESSDFYIGSIHSGDSMQKIKRIFGTPTKYSKSLHYTTVRYEDKDKTMRFLVRNDTASILKRTVGERKAVRVGVEDIFLSKGKNVIIGRGMRLKYPVEMLLRLYGVPTNVLRDADANVYYFIYENPNKDDMYVFAVGNRRVERVALMPVRPPFVEEQDMNYLKDRKDRLERDFTLMGFGLEKPFQPNKYNMWNNLVQRKGDDFWLYGDYGVEVDRRNTVKKVFLLTNNAYTSRGATLGYHMSTVFALYGKPDRVEVGPEGEEKSVDAYYYDSPYQKGVSLVFVAKHESQYVDDVILTGTPITNLQDPMERYGLK